MNKLSLYLPTNENQDYPDFQTWACVNYSICSLFETYLNRMLREKTMTLDNAQWLHANGYLDKYGSLNFSDQYNGIMSGTEYGKGNYFEKVIESVLRDGLVPDSIFTDEPHSPQQYYDATLISQKMLNLGQEFLKRFQIQVINKNATLDVLKTDLLWLTVNVGEGYGWKDPIPPSVMPPSHAVLGYDIDGKINDIKTSVNFFDTYPEYRKRTSIVNVYARWRLSINQITKTMKLIKASEAEKDTFLAGEDGKIRLIENWETMEELHEAGIVNKNLKPIIEDISKYQRGKNLVAINFD